MSTVGAGTLGRVVSARRRCQVNQSRYSAQLREGQQSERQTGYLDQHREPPRLGVKFDARSGLSGGSSAQDHSERPDSGMYVGCEDGP